MQLKMLRALGNVLFLEDMLAVIRSVGILDLAELNLSLKPAGTTDRPVNKGGRGVTPLNSPVEKSFSLTSYYSSPSKNDAPKLPLGAIEALRYLSG